MDLTGRNILITGASKGIGRTAAITCAHQGARVLACARSNEPLQSLVENSHSLRGHIMAISADITQVEDRKRFVETANSEMETIDVLINNAGILGPRASIAEYPDDTWDKVIDVNLNAMFHLTKMIVPFMLKQGSGRIINITSGVGVQGSAQWGAYAVSKFGVEGFTQILADELDGTGVETNAINPGPIATDMRAEAYPEEDPNTIPSPADIMDAFLFLASESSAGTNGVRYEAQEFQFS